MAGCVSREEMHPPRAARWQAFALMSESEGREYDQPSSCGRIAGFIRSFDLDMDEAEVGRRVGKGDRRAEWGGCWGGKGTGEPARRDSPCFAGGGGGAGAPDTRWIILAWERVVGRARACFRRSSVAKKRVARGKGGRNRPGRPRPETHSSAHLTLVHSHPSCPLTSEMIRRSGSGQAHSCARRRLAAEAAGSGAVPRSQLQEIQLLQR